MRENSQTVLPPSLPPRGLRRPVAAAYLGVSPSKFDQGRKEGIVPPPKLFSGVEVWCRAELDLMFSELQTKAANDNSPNPWDTDAP